MVAKKEERKKDKREKGKDDKTGVIFRVIRFIMVASCIVVKFTQRSLGALHAALVTHVERLNSLLKPSWPDVDEIQDKMYGLVDTLMVHGVDQKWFSVFA
jgi:hypothetical protein